MIHSFHPILYPVKGHFKKVFPGTRGSRVFPSPAISGHPRFGPDGRRFRLHSLFLLDVNVKTIGRNPAAIGGNRKNKAPGAGGRRELPLVTVFCAGSPPLLIFPVFVRETPNWQGSVNTGDRYGTGSSLKTQFHASPVLRKNRVGELFHGDHLLFYAF